MKKIAVIDQDIVINKIVADSVEKAEMLTGKACIDISEMANVEIGYSYDASAGSFASTKPFDSWVMNTLTMTWEAPSNKPADGNEYDWNEELQEWELVVSEPEIVEDTATS